MKSISLPMNTIEFPSFTGLRVYMKQALASVAHQLVQGPYSDIIRKMIQDARIPADQMVFITIDEKELKAGEKHRRGGAHVDGIYETVLADTGRGWGQRWNTGWLNGTPGRELSTEGHMRSYTQSDRGGMLIASNHVACQVWLGELDVIPGQGGSCEEFRDQLANLDTGMMEANRVYKTNSTCIHESLPVQQPVKRQLLRITLPETYIFQ